MKNYLYLLLICCLVGYTAQAQRYTHVYKHEEGDHSYTSYSFWINIADDYYQIESEISTGGGGCGMFMPVMISYGFVMRSHDTLVLRDVRCGYNMMVIVTDTTLQVLKGYEYFKQIPFARHDDTYEIPEWYRELCVTYQEELLNRKSLLDSLLYLSALPGKKDLHDSGFHFQPGLYGEESHSYKDGVKYLDTTSDYGAGLLFTDSTYKYSYQAKLFSTGEWRKWNNYILLKDHMLNTYFVLRLTGDNKFTTEVFPFANYSLDLIRFR